MAVMITHKMNWADADSMSDLGQWQTVTKRVMAQTSGLEPNQFGKDLKNVLVEKSAGTAHTKVNNGVAKGGVYIYVDIYKYFTDTPGLGLAEAARKLMSPDPIKSE